jgi:hypothetical protein
MFFVAPWVFLLFYLFICLFEFVRIIYFVFTCCIIVCWYGYLDNAMWNSISSLWICIVEIKKMKGIRWNEGKKIERNSNACPRNQFLRLIGVWESCREKYNFLVQKRINVYWLLAVIVGIYIERKIASGLVR